jgi:transposase
MRTVDDFAEIRRLHRDGLSARQIARRLRVGRDTIRKALANPEPRPYTRSAPRPAPTFGPFRPIVDAILDADQTAPRKQRHTATQIYRRLVAEHGYAGSYHPVQRHLKDRRRGQRETLVPLDHAPGHRCEADFGHIHVDFPDGRRLVPVLVMTWSYSNAPFAVALPTERTEAVLHGMSEAFAFFGGVPREVWWDNPATVAVRVGRGRERTMHPRYAALASHYTFAGRFCLPATPQEKPRVENRVKDLERRWATPVPRVKDLAELNEHLRRCCLQARDRSCGSNAETVGVRFERDLAAAGPLPARAFDACVFDTGRVDKYQTVAFDGNRYSVPRRYAFGVVTIRGFVDRVEVMADHHVVAMHRRSYARRERILDPRHFLAVLEHKPATLDHAPVLRDWHLPSVPCGIPSNVV